MKILFFLGLTNPSPGAAWTRISFFAVYFRKRGHKVDVAGTFSKENWVKAGSTVWEGIRIFNICPTLRLKNILFYLFNFFSIVLTLIPFFLFSRPKMVIISVPPVDSAICAFLASRLVRTKVIIDYRDEYEDYKIGQTSSRMNKKIYKLLKALMTKVYLRSELVIAVTKAVAKSLFSRGVINVRIVSNGADITVFRPYDRYATRKKLGIKNHEFIIIYSGKIGEYYRLDVVINALVRLDNEIRNKLKLLLVGVGPDLSKIMALAKVLGLENNVIYLGIKKDKKELAKIISASDVGLIPYDDNPLWRNALPSKFFEYCACGIPVIATVYGDSILARMVRDHQIGLVVPPMNDEALGKAIKRVYEDRSYKEAAGSRARKLVEERFDRNKIAEKFLQLVEEAFR